MAALVVGLCMPSRAQGQQAQEDTTQARQVEIIESDSLVQVVEGGERVQKLVGSVRLRQGETWLSADRATRYRQRGEILFTGDVLIIDEGDSLWADRVRYDSQAKVGRATGDVRVSDGEVLLAGPTGRYFFNEKRAVFPERVMLVDSVRVLKSRGGEYFSRDKRAEFYQQVRVFSDSTYLEADSVTYHRRTEVSEARGHVFIERRGDRAEEEANSRANEEEERLNTGRDREALAVNSDMGRADTATVRSRRPSLLGRTLPVDTTRRALLPDTTARVLLWGDRAYNDPRDGYSRVTGQALLIRLQPPDSSGADTTESPKVANVVEGPSPAGPDSEAVPDSGAFPGASPSSGAMRAEAASPPREAGTRPSGERPDTLIVRARQLETTRSDTLRRLTATDSVRLWQADLQAVSDSAVYDRWPAREDSTGAGRERRQVSRFFGDPFSWSTDAQLSGDSLRVTGRGQTVRRLFARGNAFLAQEDSVLAGRLQQLKGRRMTGYFARDSAGETTLRRLDAGPNAEAIYFQKKGDSTLAGAVRVSSDSIVFRIRGGELQKMRVLSGVEGHRYEAENVPDPFRLDGLVWVPERRPRKEAFLTEERVRRQLVRPDPSGAPPGGSAPPDAPPADPPPAAAASTSDG